MNPETNTLPKQHTSSLQGEVVDCGYGCRGFEARHPSKVFAFVAHLDRVPDFESGSSRFEPCRTHIHKSLCYIDLLKKSSQITGVLNFYSSSETSNTSENTILSEFICRRLKRQGLIKAYVVTGSKQDTNFGSFLQGFWDYDSSVSLHFL